MKLKLTLMGLILAVGSISSASSLICQNNRLQVGVYVDLTKGTAIVSTWAPDFLELTDGQPYQLTPQLRVSVDGNRVSGQGLDLQVNGTRGVMSARTAVKFTSPIKNLPVVCKHLRK